ncbi:MAG TPA: hypothetical protein VMU34_00395 [Mycobacterium sp.]|nr:hypothetical protein [Mycobacterium sp.]
MKSDSMAGMNMSADTPDAHGMFMFGADAIFLSHMPMFTMANHMYQVVLRVSLPPDAKQLYRQQQAAHPQAVRNLLNSADDLYVLPELQRRTRTQFKADLFADYDNDDARPVGDPYASAVAVQVEQVVHFRRFDATQPRPTHLRYLLFGTAGQAHLSHFIAKDPDFQHILTLATVPTQLTAGQLGTGVLLDLPDRPSTPISCTPPLTPGTSVSVVAADQSAPAFDLDLTGAGMVWFSTGNLLNATDPCAPVSAISDGASTSDFARDIAPLFRPKDIQHMGPNGVNIVDLTSATDVRDKLDLIIAVLRAKTMPPPPDPSWSPDQIALLEQWRSDGFPPVGPGPTG